MIILEKIRIKKWNAKPENNFKRSESFELKKGGKTFYTWIKEYNNITRYFCSFWHNNDFSRHFVIKPEQDSFSRFEDAEKYAKSHILKIAGNN